MNLDQQIRQHKALVGNFLLLRHDDVLRMQGAALKVIALHSPRDVHHVDITDGAEVVSTRLSHQVCAECSDQDYVDALEFGDVVGLDDGVRYPCPTVAAIASSLGLNTTQETT